jgi:mRNA interferase RelE/StbE
MSEERRFEVRLHPDAVKEYKKLDGSVVNIVNKAIDELELRADETGKTLGNNKNTKLAGCKEKKLRDAGIRIIFKITDERVDILRIVYILTIEKRRDDLVFKIAHNRNTKLKKSPKNQLLESMQRSKIWIRNNKK